MKEPADCNSLDIHAPDFAADPYPTYSTLRTRCPVAHSERYGGHWLLTRYGDVRAAALNYHDFTSSVPGVTAIPVITPRTEPQLPLELDPPLHARYRALVNPVFSKRRVDELRPTVEGVVAELLDKLLERGRADLVADYAVPLSVRTLAAFTGLPAEDAPLWVAWIARMFNVRDPEGGARAGHEFGRYIDELIRARKGSPRDDFISLLLASEVEGERLTDAEIRSFCTLVFGAGFETTADALSVTLHYLAEHPEALKRLRAEPDLIPTAVEEFVRYGSPIQIFGRNAARDVTLYGQTVPAGDVVALSFAAANHDPEVFAEPERCVLDRQPNRHLGFGAGVHLCLGAPVARLELEVTLRAFCRRVQSWTLIELPTWKTRGDRRGLARLAVTFG